MKLTLGTTYIINYIYLKYILFCPSTYLILFYRIVLIICRVIKCNIYSYKPFYRENSRNHIIAKCYDQTVKNIPPTVKPWPIPLYLLKCSTNIHLTMYACIHVMTVILMLICLKCTNWYMLYNSTAPVVIIYHG